MSEAEAKFKTEPDEIRKSAIRKSRNSYSQSEIRNSQIVFEDVSKFYGEILGVNRVNLQIASRHHESCRTKWRGQVHVDESDDRAAASDSRQRSRFWHTH